MVPPSIGKGCAKTTAARGRPTGRSISTSSGPAGPGSSRTGSANASVPRPVAIGGLGERDDNARKLAGTRDQAQVSCSRERDGSCVRPDLEILLGHPDGDHPIEGAFSCYDERRDVEDPE